MKPIIVDCDGDGDGVKKKGGQGEERRDKIKNKKDGSDMIESVLFGNNSN